MRLVKVFILTTLVTRCASMAPTKVVDGVAVYVRPEKDVAQYCYGRIRAVDRAQPHIYGCYVPGDRLIMVEEGHPEVLAHELKHAQGWEHRGACHSSKAHPDGLKPDGTSCDWYKR